MMKVTTVEVGLAKNVSSLHGVNRRSHTVVVGASGGALPELSPWFFQRFGGLNLVASAAREG